MTQFHFRTGGNALPINETSGAMGAPRNLVGFLVHCPTAPTTSENITLTLISALGTNYNQLLVNKDMAAATDYQEMPADCKTALLATDKLQIRYTNTDAIIITATAITENA